MLRFGTKWPSITSTWMRLAPAASTSLTCSPSREKSADRIEGAIMIDPGVGVGLVVHLPESVLHVRKLRVDQAQLRIDEGPLLEQRVEAGRGVRRVLGHDLSGLGLEAG